MSGLLGGVLPAIYSQADRAKRYLGGLLADPVGRMEQAAGQAQADLSKLGLLSEQAFSDPKNPMKLQDNAAARQLVDTYLNSVMNFAPVGMHVWHGSPHKFNKFDSSKIGTGEGAQAYGHGLYLAESPDVARQYQEKLTDPAFKYVGMNEAKMRLNEKIAKRVEATDPARAAALRAEVASLGDPGGALYKVDLPDDAIAKMLDWDKPLSQQAPEVQKGIRELGELIGDKDWQHAIKTDDKGSWFYRLLEDAYKSSPRGASVDTATDLRQMGIPGIRYLDGGSRGTGAGTSNFVVFPGNESLLSILERNGQPLR